MAYLYYTVLVPEDSGPIAIQTTLSTPPIADLLAGGLTDYPNSTRVIYPTLSSFLQNLGVSLYPTYSIYSIFPYLRPFGDESYGLDDSLAA